MPKLNLKDDGFEEDNNPLDSDQSVSPPPTLREVGVSGGGAKTSTILTVLLVVAGLMLTVFALNYFKVIHLWGKRAPKVTVEQEMPPADLPMAATTDAGTNPASATQEPTAMTPEPTLDPSASSGTTTPSATTTPAATSKPSSTPKFTPPPSGSGSFTVQVSSWASKTRAEKEASKLSAAGMSAFVEEGVIAGENWYRVRVGRYGSSTEAKAAAAELSKSLEGQIWVAKASSK
jgi:hypothetical protein